MSIVAEMKFVREIEDTSLKNSRILVIDDSGFSRDVVGEVFRQQGFKNIEFAVDGQDGLEKTSTFEPQLVILDLNMPKVNGFTYCERIRKDRRFFNIPILVQSGESSSDWMTMAFKAGATDFITKPINADEVIARAIVHLENQSLMSDLEVYRNRVRAEMDSAIEMQNTIMPSAKYLAKMEEDYGIKIGSFFQPSSELGGDFWGIRHLSHTEFAIYVVDFSGHGTTAAINTFRLHTILEEQVNFYTSPPVFLSKLNNRLVNLLYSGQFATMFYGVVNIEENTMSYSTAGALPPILLSADRNITMLTGEGIPLGATKNSSYDVHETDFMQDDTLLLYSDAMVETEDSNGKFMTEDDLIDFMKHTDGCDVEKMVQDLVNKFHTHGKGLLKDDLTINIYKRCT